MAKLEENDERRKKAGHDFGTSGSELYCRRCGCGRSFAPNEHDADMQPCSGTREEPRHAETKVRVAVRVDAGHDKNGNPRRGWLIVDENGDTIEFIGEGWNGNRVVGEKYGRPSNRFGHGIPETLTLKITPGTYRALLKLEIS